MVQAGRLNYYPVNPPLHAGQAVCRQMNRRAVASRMVGMAEFVYGDCGQPGLVPGTGTQADLSALRVSMIREQFDRAIYQAVANGHGYGRRSSSMLGRDVERAIDAVANEYPNASEDSINAAYAAYRAHVREERSYVGDDE